MVNPRYLTVRQLQEFLSDKNPNAEITLVGEYCASDRTGFEAWEDDEPDDLTGIKGITLCIPE